MKCRRRRSARDEAARKAWDAEAAKWDGTAHVWNPFERKYELAERYKEQLAEPMMAFFDRLPPLRRARIANSASGDM